MANKKTDKKDTKTKSAAVKPTAAKATQSTDAKKTTVKTQQPANTKKPSITKVASAKIESAGAKKLSTDKPAAKMDSDVKNASTQKPAAAKSDVKKPSTAKTDTPASAVKSAKNSPVKPNPNEAMRLSTQAMKDFIISKQEKSMAHFYNTIAKAWQKMTTVEKLNAAFSTILADASNWSFLAEVWPQLIKDGLSDRGDWVVVGVYPTKPKKLIFDQIFVHEDGEWKLAELKLYTAD